MEKAKLMQLEIEEKRKLPKNVKDNISTNIFQDLLVALIIMAYFCVINFSFYHYDGNVFEEHMKYFALGIIVFTVIAFEIAYRKNSLKLTIIGLELLSCGILSLYIPYIFLHTTNVFRISIMGLPIILLIYYAIKALVVFKQKQFHYQNNLSDVKEILKETEKRSYLDEESTKSYRAKAEREKEYREKVRKQQKIKSEIKNKNQEHNRKNKKKSKRGK